MSKKKKQELLNDQGIKTLRNKQLDLCENEIRETDLFTSMKSIKTKKTLSNDGFTHKKNYEKFWDKRKNPLIESTNRAFCTKT